MRIAIGHIENSNNILCTTGNISQTQVRNDVETHSIAILLTATFHCWRHQHHYSWLTADERLSLESYLKVVLFQIFLKIGVVIKLFVLKSSF
jgi:fatty acid desaturase